MKTKGWCFIHFIFLSLMIESIGYGQQFLLMFSNTVPANSLLYTNFETKDIPLIEVRDAPISIVIENLARRANVNYLVDPIVIRQWASFDANGYGAEPITTFRWKNLTAKEALLRLLAEYHLVWAEDPATSIAQITHTNQASNSIDMNLLGNDTNSRPLIHFQDVPLDVVLTNLVQIIHGETHTEIILDPNTHKSLLKKFSRVPVLSFIWRNVTAEQAAIALCHNYGFEIIKDSDTETVRIRSKD